MRSGEQRLDESKQQDRRKGRGKRKEGSKKNTELTRVINSTAHSCIAQHSTALHSIAHSCIAQHSTAQHTAAVNSVQRAAQQRLCTAHRPVPVYAAKAHGTAEAHLHAFLTAALDDNECWTSRPGRCTSGEEPPVGGSVGPRTGLGGLHGRGGASDLDTDLAVPVVSTCNTFVTTHVAQNPACPPPKLTPPLAVCQTHKRSSNVSVKPHSRLSKSGLTFLL